MIVALLGLVISLFAYLIAFPQPHQRRFDIYIVLFAFHIIATIAYWTLSFETPMDAFTYFRDPYNFIEKNPFESGTYFLVHLTQFIRANLGGSFLDHFLFFQAFGMVAMALMLRIYWEMADSLEIQVPAIAYVMLFLPGLHFWSVAIGKDGPIMMAVVLAAWSVMKLPQRAIWYIVALAIMVLIRPHIAAISVVGLGVALALGKQLRPSTKIMLAPVALVAFVLVVGRVQERFGVEDFDTFTTFVDRQQQFNETMGGGVDLQSQPFPMKLFALLFRPLFFEARGVSETVAGFENVALMVIFGYIIFHWKTLLRLVLSVSHVAYCATYSGILIILLAMVNYNIGLGQRQKMMAIPTVIVIAAAIFMYRRYLKRAALQEEAVRMQTPAAEPSVVGPG